MSTQGSGRKVLHFAVTGALLGGGAATGCASKTAAPVEEPGPSANPGPVDEAEAHAEPADEDEPHTNPGPAGEERPNTPTHVNTAPVDAPSEEPPSVAVNPAPQPEPSK
ncbi:MAG: hypothetical protein AAGF11_01290 [Myxococcota bacterium]